MAGDPRNDPRAQDLLRADPAEVSSLVGVFRTVAMQAQSTTDGLHGAANDATWTGSAASAFRQGVGQLPADLNKVTSSYHEAADALAAYEGEVSSLKPAFQSIVSQLASADGALATAQSSLSSAQSALNTAQSKLTAQAMTTPLAANPLPGVPLSSPLHTAVNAASSAIGNAQGEISALSARGFSILDEFESARNAAKGRVSSASQIPPHRSFWDSVFHDIGNGLSAIGHFVEGIGVGIWNSVTGTWTALQNFANDPSLATFGELAKDVAVDASIVALASAAPEALGLLGAEAAAEGGAAGAADASVSLLARTASGLADAGQPAAQISRIAMGLNAGTELGQGHYVDFAIDGVFMSLPTGDSVANKLGVGEQQVTETTSTSQALQTYQWFTDHGFTPSETVPLLSKNEAQAVFGNVANLGNGGDVAAATAAAKAAAEKASRAAARVGAPLAYGVDSTYDHASEVSKEAVGRMLHPEPTPAGACP